MIRVNQEPLMRTGWAGRGAAADDFLYFSTKWTCCLLGFKELIATVQGRPYPNDVKIHRGD